MNKKIISGVIIAVIILLAGGFFVFSRIKQGGEEVSETSEEGMTPSPTVVSSQPKSLRDLIGLGTAQTCTFSKNDQNGSTGVKIYIDNGKIRGDISSVISDVSTMSHMIIANNAYYMWVEGQTQGFKMAYDPAKVVTTPAASGSVNPDEKADYSCSPWIADASLFTIPANIKFSDFGSISAPTSAPGTGSANTTNKCAACDYATGDTKSQCLTALGCPQ